MNVANLSLCKELYELSGWMPAECEFYGSVPLYTLGYLLRKLNDSLNHNIDTLTLVTLGSFGWEVQHKALSTPTVCEADTPEDAACKLAIELFKQGLLKRD